MKNKYILYILAFFLILFISNCFYSVLNGQKLSLIKLNGVNYANENLENKKNLFIYFSTDCGSCEGIISKIIKKGKILNEYNILFVTKEQNISTINFFVKKNKIDLSKIEILIDKYNSFEDFFEIGLVINYPTLYLYDTKTESKKVVSNINEI